MKKMFLMQTVQCNNCKWAVAANNVLTEKENDIVALASLAHKQSGIICSEPQLVVIYTNALVSNVVKKPLVNTNVNPN